MQDHIVGLYPAPWMGLTAEDIEATLAAEAHPMWVAARWGAVRVSPYLYNDLDDIERLCALLEQLLPQSPLPSASLATCPGIRVRFHIIRNACIENVGKSQSCMLSKLRIIWKQTVGPAKTAGARAGGGCRGGESGVVSSRGHHTDSKWSGRLLLAFGIDGTLITEPSSADDSPSQRTIDAICSIAQQHRQQEEVIITLATGRGVGAALAFARRHLAGCCRYVIGGNGKRTAAVASGSRMRHSLVGDGSDADGLDPGAVGVVIEGLRAQRPSFSFAVGLRKADGRVDYVRDRPHETWAWDRCARSTHTKYR